MKMNYLLRSKDEQRRKGPRIGGPILVVLVLILALNFFKPDLFSGLFQGIGRPLWIVSGWAGQSVHSLGVYFQSKKALAEENEKLKQQLFDQSVPLLNLQTLQAENDKIKQVLGRTNQKKLIYVSVLQGPGFSPYDTFILDGGENVGIHAGDKITVDGVVALGYIKEVYSKTSLARLYSSSGETMEVVIEGRNTLVSAEGRGGGNFQMEVPRALNVQSGTHVLLTGFSPELVGIVNGVDTNVAQSLQTLYFSLPFNIQSVRAVYVEPSSKALSN